MSKTFDDLKLGDSVWLDGKEMFFGGFNVNVSPNRNLSLTNDKMVIAFCVDIDDSRLSLIEPLPKLKKGQPIWVRSGIGKRWWPRFFIGFTSGGRCIAAESDFCWNLKNPAKIAWNEFSLPTLQDLIDAGIDPDAWETVD